MDDVIGACTVGLGGAPDDVLDSKDARLVERAFFQELLVWRIVAHRSLNILWTRASYTKDTRLLNRGMRAGLSIVLRSLLHRHDPRGTP
jgi:hypothetical protein